MINTFEFIETKSWCRLASNSHDLFLNQGAYLPLFSDEQVFIDAQKFIHNQPTEQIKLFFETHSNGGFKLNELLGGISIGGAVLAHLGKTVIKDSTLLVLVSDNLALVEGYGNRRWAEYQINTFPSFHNYPQCLVGVDQNSPPLKMRVKAYSIDKKIQTIPISAIYLTVRSQDSNIYHWLIETLVRLKCLDDVPELKNLPLIVRDPLSSFQVETLRIMGIENKLIVTNGESFEINDLYFPSIPSPPSLHPNCMRWLRDKFLKNLPKLPVTPRRRLYISRKDSNRQVSNEDEIFKYLASHGFEKLVMSKLSVVEQIDAFRTAEIVILPHGAAGTHLLFAPLDCRVIELHSPKWINNCYLSICNSLGLRYRWLIGTETDNKMSYRIHLGELTSVLEGLK